MSQAADKKKIKSWHMVIMAATLLVTACLPESGELSEKRLAEFAQNEAKSYAATLSSFTSESQKTLSQNSAFQNKTLAQGLIGRSSDRTMSYGYCADGDNHMMISWISTATSAGKFAVKGLGEGAGSAIVDALGKFSPPETIGYFDTNIELRGPRDNGSQSMPIPAGCALSIPAGAPVMIAENMAAPNTAMGAVRSYVYRTVDCTDGQIGFTTERCEKTTASSCDPGGKTGWEPPLKKACNNTITEKSVTIKTDTKSLIGALDLGSGSNVEKALNALSDIKCVNVKKTEKVKDKTGKLIDKEIETMADSCDAANIKIKKYEGPDLTRVTDKVVSEEVAHVGCSGQDPATVAGRLAYGGKTYSGSLKFLEWVGQAEYKRYIYQAKAVVNDAAKKHGDTTQRGTWFGSTLSCTRAETFVIACNKLFPQYNDSVRYEIVSGGGITFKRTNRVNGWKDASKMIPNDPLSRDQNWSMSAVNCTWDEVRTFDCPQHTLKQLGKNKRRITATKGNFDQPTVAAWRKVTPLKCEKVDRETKSCPANSGGGGGGGSRGTSGSSGANNGE